MESGSPEIKEQYQPVDSNSQPEEQPSEAGAPLPRGPDVTIGCRVTTYRYCVSVTFPRESQVEMRIDLRIIAKQIRYQDLALPANGK